MCGACPVLAVGDFPADAAGGTHTRVYTHTHVYMLQQRQQQQLDTAEALFCGFVRAYCTFDRVPHTVPGATTGRADMNAPARPEVACRRLTARRLSILEIVGAPTAETSNCISRPHTDTHTSRPAALLLHHHGQGLPMTGGLIRQCLSGALHTMCVCVCVCLTISDIIFLSTC